MPESFVWRWRTGEIVLDRTRVMGILNVTPDSFSDGRRFLDPDVAVHRGLEMVEEGADIVDVGGESTRPGSDPVTAEDEWKRIFPVVRDLAGKVDVPVSVDTRKPEVAAKALKGGASLINDVSGLHDPAMVRAVAQSGAGAILMHMQGDPKTMQARPQYQDVVQDVTAFLGERVRQVVAGGIPREAVAVDPGIGFGKDLEHNLTLLQHLDSMKAIGRPIVVGVSRKSFLKRLGAGDEASERLAGSLAAATLAVAHGAHVIRAHDVGDTVRAMRVVDGVLKSRTNR